jgi:hypothetical protein
MRNAHIMLMAGIVSAGLAGVADAETAAARKAHAAPAAASSGSAASARVETWTKKQWDSAQKEWAKDKAKWSGCQKQSGEHHLDGRKSWSFLYTCMTG